MYLRKKEKQEKEEREKTLNILYTLTYSILNKSIEKKHNYHHHLKDKKTITEWDHETYKVHSQKVLEQ